MNFIGICLRCAKDKSLLRLIAEQGSCIDRCEICEGCNQLALPASDLRLKRMMRALIRWNYFEWDHAHGSVNHLVDLFDQENPILSAHVTQLEDLEFVLGELVALSDQSGSSCADIPIARAETVGTGVEPYLAMCKADPPLIARIASELASKNHDSFEKETLSAISKYCQMIEEQIPEGTEFFRARIGITNRRLVQLDNGIIEAHYEGHSGAEMGPPHPPIASAGRLNRAGVSFLYIATDECTAVSEIRPHPGHKVSVARATSSATIKVARLTGLDFFDYYESEELLNFYWLMQTLDKLFSMPITPEERQTKYIVSQVFSDAFRLIGFEGIRYRSGVGTGENLVVFDCDGILKFDASECVLVERLKYEYKALPVVNDFEFDYDTMEREADDRDAMFSDDER